MVDAYLVILVVGALLLIRKSFARARSAEPMTRAGGNVLLVMIVAIVVWAAIQVASRYREIGSRDAYRDKGAHVDRAPVDHELAP